MAKGMKKCVRTVPAALGGERLDKAVAGLFGEELGWSRRFARDRIAAGAVYVNGKRCQLLGRALSPGDQVQVFVSDGAETPRPPSKPQQPAYRVRPEDVIFEDQDLLVLNKPAGLPSQATVDDSRHHLFKAVQEHVRVTGGAAAYAGMHQRLDRDTSGVIVFTKSKRANAPLAEQIAGHKVTKIYWAIATQPKGSAAATWEVKNHLAKGPGQPTRMRSVRSGGDPAETSFRLLEALGDFALIQAEPRTGRMHQIRVHLAEGGRPILGDRTYGGKWLPQLAPRLMLHARELHLLHPITREPLRLLAPLPADFEACLARLATGTTLAQS